MDESSTIRFITKEVVVRILNIDYERASKISLIPVWDSVNAKWAFKFLKYMEKMHISPYPISANSLDASYLKFGDKTESL